MDELIMVRASTEWASLEFGAVSAERARLAFEATLKALGEAIKKGLCAYCGRLHTYSLGEL